MIYAVIDFAFFRQHHNVILRAVRYIQSPHLLHTTFGPKNKALLWPLLQFENDFLKAIYRE